MKRKQPLYIIIPCDQQWNDMSPNTDGTRHCAQCQKNIVNFQNMQWEEIKSLQEKHNYTLCGIYKRSQFRESPRRIPFLSAGRLVFTSFFLWLISPLQSPANGNSSPSVVLPSSTPQSTPDTKTSSQEKNKTSSTTSSTQTGGSSSSRDDSSYDAEDDIGGIPVLRSERTWFQKLCDWIGL